MTSWYYVEGGEAKGPVEDAELLRLAQEGALDAATLVTPVGATSWSALSDFEGQLGLARTTATGYRAGDATTVARVEGRMRLGAGWVSTILQRTVVELWSDSSASARVQAAKGDYAHRRLRLVALLRSRGVEARGRSGVNVWVPVADEVYAVTRVRDAGFAVAPGSLFRVGTPAAVRVDSASCPT